MAVNVTAKFENFNKSIKKRFLVFLLVFVVFYRLKIGHAGSTGALRRWGPNLNDNLVSLTLIC